jgi:hypothetical protein
MRRFHLIVQPAPPAAYFPLSFETACRRLQELPRLFIEPDGSFVWRGPQWQLDGLLVDRAEHVLYVELKGCCPEDALRDLLSCLREPETALTFQLPQEGRFFSEGALAGWLKSEN